MEWNVIVGVCCTVLGALVGYLTFLRNRGKDDKSEGKQSGTILAEIGYIKGGIDDIKTEQREQRKTNTELITRLTAVEASAKQAHRRLDIIEERRERP